MSKSSLSEELPSYLHSSKKLIATQKILFDAITAGNTEIIDLCLEDGIIPDNLSLMKIAELTRIKTCKCNMSCYRSKQCSTFNSKNIKLFKKCIKKYGAQPTLEILEFASKYNQSEIFKICLNKESKWYDYLSLMYSIIFKSVTC